MTAPDEPAAEVDPAQLDDRELRASVAHEQWANRMRAAGWRYGDVLDLPGLTHHQLVPFDQLPAAARAQYLDTVDR